MKTAQTKKSDKKKYGLLVGGSGLIGGYLMHYFKTETPQEFEIRAPNSKKLSLREQEDIKGYFIRFKPDFIINTAIAAINSDAQLAYEVNYLGSIYLARAALALKIPYIHISSAVTVPSGEDLAEEDRLPLSQGLSNYAKSKLMTEMTLRHMHENLGLDYTMIRLGVVYGAHDHKVQGAHRLLFNIVEQAMPFMLTRKGVKHSYTNANKLPYFVHHIIENRQEFSGHLFHFVDQEPVDLSELILTIKSYLELATPKEIYVPYHIAIIGKFLAELALKGLGRMGVKARVPAEVMFLEHFYRTQTLSSKKLHKSSFIDPFPEATIYTELPALIEYYLARWEHLNLITSFNTRGFKCPKNISDEFINSPKNLLDSTHEKLGPLSDIL